MAKALIGHLHHDPRTATRLAAQNHHLRTRVADLESLVARLQQDNDRLAAAHEAAVSALVERETAALEEMVRA